MIKKVDHIGIVVKDLDSSLEIYSKELGFECVEIREIQEVELRIAVLQAKGIGIELLQYRNPEMEMVKALRGNLEGLNHICYEVEGFDDAMKRLMENGFKLIEGFPRKGVHGRIAFFIPPHSPEERIEILEVKT